MLRSVHLNGFNFGLSPTTSQLELSLQNLFIYLFILFYLPH